MSLLDELARAQLASRIWKRDTTAFAPAPVTSDIHRAIANRLGWLDLPATMVEKIPELEKLAANVQTDGLQHAYILGMGGSSLCAEVLSETAGSRPGMSVTVLDSTDEKRITETEAVLDAPRALFIVASKSGTTIEASSLERYFGSVLSQKLGAGSARHFAAITDPETPLIALAGERGYRKALVNPPDVGGRYSALSVFGLLPAALLGLDVTGLLTAAQAMAARCKQDHRSNPGQALGAFMAENAMASPARDKLTVVLPPKLAPLSAWIEQLVAESTGKKQTGILPVVDEPLAGPEAYDHDRAFVVIDEDGGDLAARAAALETAGHPVFRIQAESLGAEFFRWEFATAVAGAALGINPFDEPDVASAKKATKTLLEQFEKNGKLPDPPLTPVEDVPGCAMREHRSLGPPARRPYVAILDYLPVDSGRRAAMDGLRQRIRDASKMATTYGVGPRYLHSTGQYHKGGPNSGRFILLTADDATATHVPREKYTFSVLKKAQALGDFNALTGAGRDVVHFHFTQLPANVAATIEPLLRARFGI